MKESQDSVKGLNHLTPKVGVEMAQADLLIEVIEDEVEVPPHPQPGELVGCLVGVPKEVNKLVAVQPEV